ncbi:IS66 family insertion sequence element accessory protein TnpB [Budvicia aquatica]|uniref:IS66 Orf2 like protein n=1 Tax=Budvicia aquatica TaxID=82979 RepID=A0A2C6DIF0_9GAMM|nr:IS66 family insertion sequence element accessory protein TnpB [Budvicia aquatica]PHI30068.1 IS66 family insertion sequence hypothetical protein [Budvicia aquatica]VFS49055.1 IS66 Orf2 like protein [Budvicia aquatica]
MLKPEHLFLAVKPVDMRQGVLQATWHEGAAFVFANKARTRIKVLRWDKHGVWLCARRLHRGHFIWPRANDTAWSLTPDQFEWLISGVDWQQVEGDDLTKWVYKEEVADRFSL